MVNCMDIYFYKVWGPTLEARRKEQTSSFYKFQTYYSENYIVVDENTFAKRWAKIMLSFTVMYNLSKTEKKNPYKVRYFMWK